MRAVIMNGIGGPEVLTQAEVDRPSPAPDRVLVEITVSGVNFLDVYQLTGATPLRPPFAAGVEGVGVVAEVGTSVTDLHVGQRVGWLVLMQGVTAHYLATTPTRSGRVTRCWSTPRPAVSGSC
jgi:NADPH2:quinone reductase